MKKKRPAPPPRRRIPSDWQWLGAAVASLLLLAWASRVARFGVPVADDFDFLYWLRFHRFTFFDSMGAPYYWRPVSRQLYFVLIDPILFTAPWLVSVLHAALLAATSFFVYRIARPAFGPGVAIAISIFPLVSEPARALLVWPTGAQYILAMLGAAIAVHEALAGRAWTAAAAALGAMLSHGAAAPVLYALPLIAWLRTRKLRVGLTWAALALAVAAIWIGGHWIGREHGTQFFAGGTLDATFPSRLLRAVATVTTALFNLEDGPAGVRAFAWAGYALLLGAALFLFARDRAARARLRQRVLPLAGAAAWFLLAVAPLALLFPDWSSWRTGLAALGLGVLVVGLVGTARPWLASGFAALLAITLLVAPQPERVVRRDPPVTASRTGFLRLARFQIAVDGARRELARAVPPVPKHAGIAYWSRFGMMEVGFESEKAARVWYRDSTITWQWLWRPGGIEANPDAVLGFDPGSPRPVVLIQPATMRHVRDALTAVDHGQMRTADSLLVEAVRAQQPPCEQVLLWVLRTRARMALQVGAYDQAEKMNQATLDVLGPSAEYYGMAALLAVRRGQRDLALQNARESLARDPQNPFGLQALRELRVAAP